VGSHSSVAPGGVVLLDTRVGHSHHQHHAHHQSHPAEEGASIEPAGRGSRGRRDGFHCCRQGAVVDDGDGDVSGVVVDRRVAGDGTERNVSCVAGHGDVGCVGSSRRV